MNHTVTTGIILARTNYGEADRIITMLTPNYGKVRLMAKGVRRIKSKLAGGIELFSISTITFIRGRREIGTLLSARLIRHYGRIVSNMDRVQLGYELIKLLNKTIEDHAEEEYFDLLQRTFQALDDPDIELPLVQAWFSAQLLAHGGHKPNLHTDAQNRGLSINSKYDFDFSTMTFAPKENGQFASDEIKFLRLIFSGSAPEVLSMVGGYQNLLPDCSFVINTMLNTFIRI